MKTAFLSPAVAPPLPTSVSNASSASGAAGAWHLISPFGRHPNPAGLQIVDAASAATLQAALNGAANRLRALCGFGRATPPIYIGHPDDAVFSSANGHENTERYGSVAAIEARADGIWARFEWDSAWAAANATGRGLPKLYISPRWTMRETARGSGEYRPVKLLSIGLVQRPNIPGVDAVNAKSAPPPLPAPLPLSGAPAPKNPTANPNNTTTANIPMLAKIKLALGLKADAPDEDALAAANAAVAARDKAAADLAAANERTASAIIANKAANDALAAANASASAERKARAAASVDAAIANGKITAAERAAWKTRLSAAPDYAAAANELAAIQPAVKTESALKDAAARNTAAANAADASAKFAEGVNALMAKTGQPYNAAWAAYRATAEGKTLLEKMSGK